MTTRRAFLGAVAGGMAAGLGGPRRSAAQGTTTVKIGGVVLGDFGVTIMIAGNIPGQTQTMAVAIYDAVESGKGELARMLVLVISAIALAILFLANRLSPNPFGSRYRA